MRKQFIGLAAAALSSGGILFAQEGDDLFTKLDANKDGFVALDEVPEGQKSLFERLLRKAGKEDEKKLNKVLFAAALKSEEAPKQPLGGAGPPGRPGGGQGMNPRQIFDQFDANKDGKLTKDELPPRLQENFARLDSDNNGTVSPDEFGRAGGPGMLRPPGAPGNGIPNDPQQLAGLFDRTDANSDGKLTKDEVPEERVFMRRIFEQVGSDSLTKEQFIKAMAQAGGQPGAPGRRPESAPRPEGPAGAPERRPDGAPAGGPPPGGGLFATLDTDHDGQLSTSEIVAAGSALLKLDRNGDGKLTPDEVFGTQGGPVIVVARPGDDRPGATANPARPPEGRPGGQSPEAMRERFKASDTNHDGKLSKDEAPEFLKERFDRLDANSDGFLDETEMRQIGQRLPGAGGRPAVRRPEGARPGTEQPKSENK